MGYIKKEKRIKFHGNGKNIIFLKQLTERGIDVNESSF